MLIRNFAISALRKFRSQKNKKSGKGPIALPELMKLVQRFEGTKMVEDRARCGCPSLRKDSPSSVAAKMKTWDPNQSLGPVELGKLPDV